MPQTNPNERRANSFNFQNKPHYRHTDCHKFGPCSAYVIFNKADKVFFRSSPLIEFCPTYKILEKLGYR